MTSRFARRLKKSNGRARHDRQREVKSGGADENRAAGDAQSRCGGAIAQLRRSEPRSARANRHPGGATLPGVQGAQVHRGLSGADRHPRLHREGGGRRLCRRGRRCCCATTPCRGFRAASARRKRSARCSASAARKAARWPSATWSASSPTGRAHAMDRRRRRAAPPSGQGGGGRRRPGRADRRRRAGQLRPRGDHLRGLPQTGRGAGLRHSRVPPAQRRSSRQEVERCGSWA